MKFIAWNLENIWPSKTNVSKTKYHFQPTFARMGMGNNLLDYVSRVATGDPIWSNLQSQNPADIFVIIELKTGGEQKGANAFGQSLTTLNRIQMGMSTLIRDRGLRNEYRYKHVPPLIVGYRETVGIIYNSKSLELMHSEVLRDQVSDSYSGNFSPFMAVFRNLNAGPVDTFAVTGLHAPTASVNATNGFKAPITYALSLGNTNATLYDFSFIMGDFNCNPINYFINLRTNERQRMTDNLQGFVTPLVGKQYLTSLKNSLSGSWRYSNTDYLANAFDNILRKPEQLEAQVKILDLLQAAREHSQDEPPPAMKHHGHVVFNAYWIVSDHLPVMIEF